MRTVALWPCGCGRPAAALLSASPIVTTRDSAGGPCPFRIAVGMVPNSPHNAATPAASAALGPCRASHASGSSSVRRASSAIGRAVTLPLAAGRAGADAAPRRRGGGRQAVELVVVAAGGAGHPVARREQQVERRADHAQRGLDAPAPRELGGRWRRHGGESYGQTTVYSPANHADP